ncbi:MAG: NAD(+) synthase [Bacteroidales bacterium]|nr:NAD(+) synthase [Bacteroidales bacterium]MBO7322666.1 NAD(+) synthase [Bacteroidales bacterium]
MDSKSLNLTSLENIESIHQRLVASLRSFFKNAGMQKAVLGLSGGIDSAVVAALAAEALGSENVTGIIMPSAFSTLHSVTDAVDLADNLNIKYYIIPIEKIYDKVIKEIDPIFEGEHHWDNTQENLQARIRGMILMAFSNRRGALLLNTSNKSELAVGYGTLYGDLAGALMVIADIYKLQVYALADYINTEKEIIPFSTITKAPSAELREDQKDTDSLPDYSILDPVLYRMVELGETPEQIIESGVARELVERITKLKKGAAFKGAQMAPVIKITERPLLDKSKWITIE